MKFRSTLIVLLVTLLGYFVYKSYSYKAQYEIRKNWAPPDFCSDENLRAINFLLNSDDNSFNKARAVVALKDNGCFYDYPTLVSSAQEVVNWEEKIVKLLNKTDVVSVEMFRDYEKASQYVSKYYENPIDVVVRLNEELDKRAMKELEQLFGREKL